MLPRCCPDDGAAFHRFHGRCRLESQSHQAEPVDEAELHRAAARGHNALLAPCSGDFRIIIIFGIRFFAHQQASPPVRRKSTVRLLIQNTHFQEQLNTSWLSPGFRGPRINRFVEGLAISGTFHVLGRFRGRSLCAP